MKAHSGHRLTARIKEQFRCRSLALYCKPSANIGSGLLPERQGSLFSPFTNDTESRCWLQGYCG